MEELFRNDFIAHYALPVSTVVNFTSNTVETYFELKDDNRLIYATKGEGVAKYSNVNALNVNVLNFEIFFNSLLPAFIKGKEKCDLIVYDNTNQYFLLNELTDTLPHYVTPFINTQGYRSGKRQKAISQLLSTLSLIIDVEKIAAFINIHSIRQCCFFNKQSNAPLIITATKAFNRLSTIVPAGLRMSNSEIESFGFEFWEYSGSQVYNL